MKKYILLKLILLLVSNPLAAQKELWGVNTGDEYNPGGYYGNITKYDINGENPAIMHEFDSIHGYRPKGKLFLASNGKLYGTTLNGGNVGPVGSNATGGVLFEYDLILNQYRVVKYFEYSPANATNPNIGVIEPTSGHLYGATLDRIYKYDIATETTTFYNNVGSFNHISGEFLKASDGNLYSTSWYLPCTANNQPYPGNVIKFNMATNSLSMVYSFNCNSNLEGIAPAGQLIEVSPGKLMGVTRGGGIYNSPNGILFEYNFNTDTNTKKIDFNGLTLGGIPTPLISGNNGKLYGLCEEGGAPQTCNPDFNRGTLYEYTPATNTLEVKQYFNSCDGNYVRYPTSLIKTSVGHFVGTIPNAGTFKWDADTNTITMPGGAGAGINAFNNVNFIEICRKPSYHFFDVDTFDACVGDDFNYDVQNTNAVTYQWIKDGGTIPNQTSGVLNLINLVPTDAGNYTCLMTNECGTTTTMALHLTINCLGTNTIAEFGKSITLHPNPTSAWLNIELPKNIDVSISSCAITNLLGQTVYQATTASKIDVSQLQNGIYIVYLQTNYGKWNGKFVKN